MNPVPHEDFPDMIYPVCTVRDALTNFYPCTVEQSTQAAIRNFSMAINAMSGTMSFAPGDFTLFQIGTFNSTKGTIEPVTPIVQLASGLQVFGEKDEK